MKLIQLTQGYFALVDDEDYERVSRFKWSAAVRKHAVYGYRQSGPKKKRVNVMLHAFILDPPDGLEVDHVDRNGLNNRRSNLRLATRSQNLANTKLSRRNSSGVKGVRYDKERNKWRAEISATGIRYFLGRFDTKEEACGARSEAAGRLHGEFRNG